MDLSGKKRDGEICGRLLSSKSAYTVAEGMEEAGAPTA